MFERINYNFTKRFKKGNLPAIQADKMLNPQRILEGRVWRRVNLFILRLRNLNTVAEGRFLS